MDGAFKAYAVSLPEQSELVDKIPEADPVLLYEVGKKNMVCMYSILWRWLVLKERRSELVDKIPEANPVLLYEVGNRKKI